MKTKSLSLSFAVSSAGLVSALILSGCSANFGGVSNDPTATAMHIKGVVHGGQQPLNSAHIYMYAASTAAYGGSGIAASSSNASTSLLTAATGNAADGNGNFYVTTDVFGNFDIHGAFSCTPNTQVYLYSTGGDPQVNGVGTPSGGNSAATLMAVVGNCASTTPSAAFPNATFVAMNEITTVATAYALAGFASDPLHIGAPSAVTGHALSATGLANAFNTALTLVNQTSGLPNPTLPLNSKAVVPVTTINTLADILAACVNSSGPGSTGCATLFTNTTYGTPTTDTATAAINIAQNPGANVAALIGLATSTSPFQPFISSANDLALTVNYTGGGINVPVWVAIDAEGNAWVANGSGSSVTEISSAGAFLSGTGGFTDGNSLFSPEGVAIDAAGNAWVANTGLSKVVKLSNTGGLLSTFTGGGLNEPEGIAVDGQGNVWAANFDGGAHGEAVTEISSAGGFLSGANGYTGGGLNTPNAIAIDGAGNAWATNLVGTNVTEISKAGVFLSGTGGFTGGGLNAPDAVAIDSAGNAWVTNSRGSFSVTKFSNAGAILSGANGYIGGGLNLPQGIAIDGAGNAWVANGGGKTVIKISSAGAFLSGPNGYAGAGLTNPFAIAIDGSGNAWVGNFRGAVTEMIGVGTPVITPLVAGLPVVPTPDGTSNLGTRP